MAAAGEPAKPIVLTGLRGMGKTALLRRIATEAAAAGAVTIVAEADRSTRFVDTVRRELERAVATSRALPSRLTTTIGRFVDKLPKLSYEMPHGAGSVSIAGNEASTTAEIVPSELEGVLSDLSERLRRHARFLVICLDELQDAGRDDLLHIVRVVHQTAGTGHPVLFFGAGLPQSGTLLQSVRTYTERWAFYRLGLLSRTETYEAIDLPARANGVVWDPDAADELFARTLGYPYFVQEYASASWLRHTGHTVTKRDVQSVTEGVRRMLDESVYDRQFARLTPREATYALAVRGLGDGAHHSEAIASALGTTSPDLSSVRTQLIKKGVLYAPSRGLVEFRMPLTGEYVDRHRERLEALARSNRR
jgi:hypothetical protein